MQKGLIFLKKNFPGLLVLGVALFVYAKTAAPTVSFWDSGEFIASAALLQIPHPPGAPFYLMLARVFSLMAPDATSVAFFVNLLSAVASAFTVFFSYKILKLFFQMVRDTDKLYPVWIEELAAVSGALLFAFTDTFWYSAVEAEVYALSLFFSAITFYIVLKWFVQKQASPRLFFLGVFLLGLSIGVHLLNLLMTPVFVLLFFWKQFGYNFQSTLKGLLVGFVVLGGLFLGLVSNGLWPAMKLEILLVNQWGFPQHSGLVSWFVLLTVVLVVGLTFTFRKHPVVHFCFMIVFLLFMGWTSYLMVPVRAAAKPDINMNAPDNVFAMQDYINRTQYGSRPLLVGPHAWAQAEDWKDTYRYAFDEAQSSYVNVPSGSVFGFSEEDYVLFPRMYSRQSHHIEGYEWWSGLDGEFDSPELSHQLDFFLKYQVGHSYLRYLMWNFVGRQNDEQGHGDIVSGNWVTGIDFIDGQMIGSREHLHSGEAYNAAANQYYGLPLIFILIGFFFLLNAGRGRMRVLLLLGTIFLISGLLLVIYLNQPPYEPRERDYVYVASFWALAMLAALGIYSLLKTICRFSGSTLTVGLSGFLLFLAGPGLLFSVNLNDHDRSERYVARDLAVSQLRSCPANSILFTYGDNDTYPLWYVQQIESVRPDVRLVNLGLLHTNWYQEYIRQAQIGNDGLKMTLPKSFYRDNAAEFFPVSSIHSAPEAADVVLKQLATAMSDNDEKHLADNRLHPAWEMTLSNGKTLQMSIQRQYLSIGDLALYDIVVTNGDKRPVCFTRNMEMQSLGGISDHLKGLGLVWKLSSSAELDAGSQGSLDQKMAVFTDSISIGGNETWLDNTCRQALSASGYRTVTLELARELLAGGDKEKARKVLGKSIKEWPFSPMQNQRQMLDMAKLMQMSDDTKSASTLVENIVYVNLLDLYSFYYSGFDLEYLKRRYCGFFTELHDLALQLEMEERAVELEMELQMICSF
ncbi:DUF2723 domain-containing protein [Marinilabilia sp.]|uniref:glycosyltransferase family 117 protein n=1 Tax=Marinilabilia sp. TaxID=2021252 RepID=UPI0025BB784E|nr:DUF2723 domain-containing protein [Marinilabilia sp.]